MELPNNFYQLSRKERVSFHAERVEQSRPVGEFLDSLNTGLTPVEIRECLKLVRLQISNIEKQLSDDGRSRHV